MGDETLTGYPGLSWRQSTRTLSAVERQSTGREFAMSDDHDHDRSPTDTSEQSEEHSEDLDPMTPQTTLPEAGTEQAAREEERQLETGEENPT